VVGWIEDDIDLITTCPTHVVWVRAILANPPKKG
jgi:hypothetical protein